MRAASGCWAQARHSQSRLARIIGVRCQNRWNTGIAFSVCRVPSGTRHIPARLRAVNRAAAALRKVLHRCRKSRFLRQDGQHGMMVRSLGRNLQRAAITESLTGYQPRRWAQPSGQEDNQARSSAQSGRRMLQLSDAFPGCASPCSILPDSSATPAAQAGLTAGLYRNPGCAAQGNCADAIIGGLPKCRQYEHHQCNRQAKFLPN